MEKANVYFTVTDLVCIQRKDHTGNCDAGDHPLLLHLPVYVQIYGLQCEERYCADKKECLFLLLYRRADRGDHKSEYSGDTFRVE